MIQTKTILNAIPQVLKTIDIPSLGRKEQGKVRDIYFKDNTRILITTDRQSAFDIILGHIPFKGAVLNQLSQFWFEKTRKIIENHMIEVPDQNVMITRNCEGIPVEMIVRGYISGVTKTSIWYSYQKGERNIYGLDFPDGLKKNQKLKIPVITPTTHGGGKDGHDDRLTRDEIIKKGIISKKIYEQMEQASYELFKLGSSIAEKHGLILVDTKYEFGLYKGKLMLIDEIHTPDSSRFWIKKSYKKRFERGEEPENFDKEFLRLWYSKKGYIGDGKPPPMSKDLIVDLSKRYIEVYEKLTGKTFKTFTYPIEERIKKVLEPTKKLTYAQTGDDYNTKDPIKKLAQVTAIKTGQNLEKHGMNEVLSSRGESAYVWKQKDTYMATVIEGLGTKNLVADEMRKVTGKTYYDVVGYDTVATIINDLISVGASPLAVHAYWAIGNNDWLADEKRMKDLIKGWSDACNDAVASWGGGETPTLKGMIPPETAELGGSAVGIIKSKKRLISDEKIKDRDQIILLKSAGVNANGISLTRAIAQKLPQGYATKLSNGKMYGEMLLTKTHIYAQLLENLFKAGIDIHYLSNITGHGLRKIMRGRPQYSYIIERIYDPLPIFDFIQKHANLDDSEMYETYNMGMDYAIFIPKNDVKKTLEIIKKTGYAGIHAGYVQKGEKQVIIKPKNITYSSASLDLR